MLHRQVLPDQVIGKVGHGSLGHGPAAVHDAEIPRHSAGKGEFLLDQQHGNTGLLIETGDDVPYLVNHIGLNAFGPWIRKC
jgi:hypothetical protein